ncbi:MAG: TonB-dependent receptor [Sandaracinaceae bacterium]|nr:TonB-dependent receptor [Sandaracinaceae bacterium]
MRASTLYGCLLCGLVFGLASGARAQNFADGGVAFSPDAAVAPDGGTSSDAGAALDAPPTDASSVASSMAAPELVEFVEAEYPAAAREAQQEASVELEITIGSDGAIRSVTVATSATPEFDAAAVAAAQRFVFRPAMRNGTPVASRIRYRYVFELQEEVVPAATPEPEPTAPDPAQPASEPAPTDDAAPAPEEEPVQELSFGAVARVDPPPREVTRRTIEAEEMVRIPGTRGDALRSIELLPGVARPPGLAGLVIIRGSAPGDSQVMLESTPVPLLYHFGGLTSFYNSRMIDRIDFYPGNFSARYGRKIGGIIDVGVRDPRSDGFHGVVDLNLIDSSVLVEAPILDNLSVSIAARRSYIDFFFDKLIPSDITAIAAPVYYDYQGVISWRPTSRDRIRLLGYASADRFALNIPPSESDPTIRGNLDLRTSFYRVQADWRHQYSENVTQDISISAGETNLRFGLGDQFRLDLHTVPIVARAEWNARLSHGVRLIAGFDTITTPTDLIYYGPAVGQAEGNPSMGTNVGAERKFDTTFSSTVFRPAMFVETILRPVDPLTIIAGVRLDYYHEIRHWSFDPRLSARYAVNDQWTIKAGIGRFSQPPEFQESLAGLGNPSLTPLHALHLAAGVDHQFNETFSLGVEGFYKWVTNRPVATQNSEPPFFENAGVGRIYGMEVAGRARPRGRFFGFLSYTLSRSERLDRPGSAWRVFDFDQTHIFTVSLVYKLGRGWELGGTFRLVSGNPLTPVIGSVYDVTSNVYQPLYGMVNSDRVGLFHRFDVRLEKMWTFTNWRLAFYSNVQHVYNRMNPEGTLYNYDFRESQVVGGLPIIPSIGVRGEL